MRLMEEAIALIPDFDKLPAYGQILFIFNLLAAGVQGDREFLRIVTHEIFNNAFAFSDTASSAHRLYEQLLEIVRRGQERGELHTTTMAESMAVILLSTYFYTFINWLEMENPLQLSTMLQTHLNPLLEGMKSY
jgi:tetracycline repressor-like protein